jgi:uncharacterized protein (TIGR02996 family)
MSDESALLAAIREHPLEDAPRLVYADWLDERGGEANSARAEFIRAQCESALLAAFDPRYAALRVREKELLRAWRKGWVAHLPRRSRGAEFWRGFPVPVACVSRDRMVKLTEDDLHGAPLWDCPYATDSDFFETQLAWPQLHRIRRFSVFSPMARTTNWVARIVECPGLRNVTELAFSSCELSAADLKRILDAWTGRRLTALWVNSCPIGDTGIRLIAKHPATTELRLLRAHTIGCTSRGIKAVADGPNLDRVTLATFAHNRLGATGGKHLLRWAALPGMEALYLMNTKLTRGAMETFSARLGKRVHL